MVQSTSTIPALSSLNGKPILLNFDGAEMSSDAGLAILREVERRADLALTNTLTWQTGTFTPYSPSNSNNGDQ